ncbi:hypothetical protein [uncultured Desulfobulbus sp.]|nr:hypothetical protein [uncultured Desulfobulbus sp.]
MRPNLFLLFIEEGKGISDGVPQKNKKRVGAFGERQPFFYEKHRGVFSQ